MTDKAFSRTNLLATANPSNSGRDAAWIWSRRAWFYWDRDNVATADGIRVISDAAGGRWIREQRPDSYCQTVTDWYYDAAAGSNDNDGLTAATPIKDIAELLLRVGPDSGGVVTPVTLHLAAPLTDSEGDLFSLLTSGLRQWSTAP